MSDSKIITYYKYMIPIITLQISTVVLALLSMTPTDYGLYTLYFTIINFLYLLTLGIIEGFIFSWRKYSRQEISGVSLLLKKFIIMQIILITLLLVIVKVSSINAVFALALIAGLLMNIFQLTQGILRTTNDVHKLNIFVICSRIIFLLDVLVYVICTNIITMFMFDIASRCLLVIGCVTVILNMYRHNDNGADLYRTYIKSGSLIMISNTIFSLSLMIDKFAIADDAYTLGLYAASITIVLFFRIGLRPLNQVLFVTIDESLDFKQLKSKLSILIISCFGFIAVVNITINNLFANFDLLNEYLSLIPYISILMIMIPLMIPFETLVINISKLKNGKLYIIKSIIVLVIYTIVLCTYGALSKFNLNVFCSLVVVCYFGSFVVYSYRVIPFKQLMQLILLYLSLTITYLLIIA